MTRLIEKKNLFIYLFNFLYVKPGLSERASDININSAFKVSHRLLGISQ